MSIILLLLLHLIHLPSLQSNLPLNIDHEYFIKLVGSNQFAPLFPQESKTTETILYSSKVLVVIPGFGCRDDRTKITLNNLLILNHSKALVNLDCLIFLSCEPPDHILERLQSSCMLQTYESASYSHYLKAIVPLFLKQGGYTHLLILLDDAQLSYNYRLDTLLYLMHQNSLSVISPSVINAVYPSTSCSFCQTRLRSKLPPFLRQQIRPINLHHQPTLHDSMTIGYTTDAVEIFATLFTIRAWKCFHSLLQPTLNAAGWSYDRCFKKYCNEVYNKQRLSSRRQSSKIQNITLGIVDSMIVLHNSARLNDNAADSINGVPKPAIERNNWLRVMKLEKYLSPEDVYGNPIV